MILRWRSIPPSLTVRWRTSAGLLDAIKRQPATSVAGFLVPPGEASDPGDIAAVFLSA